MDSDTLYVLSLGIPLLFVVAWYFYHNENRRLLSKLPGPVGYPFFGNALQLKCDPVELYKQLLELTDNLPGIACLRLCGYPIVFAFAGKTIEPLLNSSKHIEKAPNYDLLHPWLGFGLLTSGGSKWKSRRRLLTPTFHFEILRDFLPVINRHAATLLTKLQPMVDATEPVDVFPFITSSTLDIICETAMGIDLDVQNKGNSEYVKAVYSVAALVIYRFFRPWLWNDFIYFNFCPTGMEFKRAITLMHGFSRKVIQERREELVKEEQIEMSTGRKRLAFLDMLICSEGALTQEDIREEVDTFMFEGHDTTSSALVWSIYLLGRHPDIQQKVWDELAYIFGSSNREIEQEDLRKMTYMECVIKETLRLYPSVPYFGRTLSEDAAIGDYVVPKGTPTLIFTSKLHRDPLVFPDPEVFDPDRFTSENSVNRHPFAYVPFAAGMRNCIGQKFAMTELKVVLASIFRNYVVESTQKPEHVAPVADMILRPSKGIFVKLSLAKLVQ